MIQAIFEFWITECYWRAVVRTQKVFFRKNVILILKKKKWNDFGTNSRWFRLILSFDQIHDPFLERGKSGGWKTSHACNIWFLSCEIEFSIKKIYFSWIVNKLIKIATLKSLISMEFFLFFLRKNSQLHALLESPRLFIFGEKSHLHDY